MPLFRFYKIEPLYVLVDEGITPSITITLPRPLTELTGSVRDGKTGTGIAADMALYLVDDKNANLNFKADSNGRFSASIPSEEAIFMHVSASGFDSYDRVISCRSKENCDSALVVNISLRRASQ